MAQERVIILGGGMASLTAAYELVKDPAVAARFDITLYQTGWRLGGKCASGRNMEEPHGRIEEHGLHVWFGCYANAFRMLFDCYDKLGKPNDMMALFDGKTDTPYLDDVEGWELWPMHFPRKFGSVTAALVAASVPRLVNLSLRYALDHADMFVRAASIEIITLPEAPSPPVVDALARLTQAIPTLRTYLDRHADEDYSDAAVRSFVTAEARRVRDLLEAPALAARFARGWFRRTRVEANIALTVSVGSLADLVFGTYDDIDDEDFREWLDRHGATDEVLVSPPVRALYDLCFAYSDGIVDWPHANFAAGAALNTVKRIALEFPDYVVYEMRAGMGEVVIAPLYEFLASRGVKFEFFHRVTQLELAANGQSVRTVHFARQVNVTSPPYDPLVNVQSPLGRSATMPAWPSHPKYGLIDNGNALRGFNLESKWSGWADVEPDLQRHHQQHFDHVILGISLREASEICASFAGKVPGWATMLSSMRTVQTCGIQLWMNETLAGLGWPHGSVPIDAGPEPLDVWADRTDLLQCETWPTPAPLSLHYLCGPLPGDWAAQPPSAKTVPDQAMQQTLALAQAWLTKFAYALWPAVATKAAFNWDVLVDPYRRTGPARLAYQYVRPNIDPTERYVLSVKGSTRPRLAADQSGLANLFLCGDWTRSEWNAGCVETAVITGRNAARALATSLGITIPN